MVRTRCGRVFLQTSSPPDFFCFSPRYLEFPRPTGFSWSSSEWTRSSWNRGEMTSPCCVETCHWKDSEQKKSKGKTLNTIQTGTGGNRWPRWEGRATTGPSLVLLVLMSQSRIRSGSLGFCYVANRNMQNSLQGQPFKKTLLCMISRTGFVLCFDLNKKARNRKLCSDISQCTYFYFIFTS